MLTFRVYLLMTLLICLVACTTTIGTGKRIVIKDTVNVQGSDAMEIEKFILQRYPHLLQSKTAVENQVVIVEPGGLSRSIV